MLNSISVIVVVMLSALLVSCNSARIDESSANLINKGCHSTEAGFYYLNDEGYIKYFDFKTQKYVFLCNKPECLHDNDKCYAASDANCFTVHDGYVYIADNDKHSLIRKNADGTNNTEILMLCEQYNSSNNSIAIPTGGIAIGEKMYITYQVDVFDSYSGETEKRAILSLVDLDKKNESIIFDDKDTQYSILNLIDGYLYFFAYTGNVSNVNEGNCALIKMDLSDNSIKVVYENIINNFYVRGVCCEYVYFCKDATNNDAPLYCIDVTTGDITTSQYLTRYSDDIGMILYDCREDKYLRKLHNSQSNQEFKVEEITTENGQQISFLEAVDNGFVFLSQEKESIDGIVYLEDTKMLFISKYDFFQSEYRYVTIE